MISDSFGERQHAVATGTPGAEWGAVQGHPRDFPVISLFLPVIFGRFPVIALIFWQIYIFPAPIYRDLQGQPLDCTPWLRHKN